VPKESGQTTGTLKVENLVKMIARLPPSSFSRAVWLINNDVLPALFTMTLSNYPIYLPPPGALRDSPFGTILGRPAIISQHANTFSGEGDVVLCDFSYYRAITKGGIDVQVSMHLYFDADATAFRAVFRVDGGPIISAPIPPAKGTTQLSPFLVLQAR
jgi:HK97 family phage major capsid protein